VEFCSCIILLKYCVYVFASCHANSLVTNTANTTEGSTNTITDVSTTSLATTTTGLDCVVVAVGVIDVDFVLRDILLNSH